MMGEKLKMDNPLAITWHDSAWIPHLSPLNVMDYFSERSNPFYDRSCNNEILKMQRLSMDQLQTMKGVEYCLLHVQEPILYVIRKQHRHSPTHVTPISDYYIIAGTVYQAPDLGSVINSRILTTVNHLQSAFEEARHFAKYHPSQLYWWDFGKKAGPEGVAKGTKKKAKKVEKKEESSSLFQRRRVDLLLDVLSKKFPPKPVGVEAPPAQNQPNEETRKSDEDAKEVKPAVTSGGVKHELQNKSNGGSEAKKRKTNV